MRNDGCRCGSIPGVNDRRDAISGEDFNGRQLCGCREGMSITAHVKRAGDSLSRPIFDNRLSDGGNMCIGEGSVAGSSPMATGSKETRWAGSLKSGWRSW